MMDDMDDLVQWLNGCYDRAEQKARAAAKPTFCAEWTGSSREVFTGNAAVRKVADVAWSDDIAAHIAGHDPAWRLADIARKRKILGRCAAEFPGEPGDFRGGVRNFAEATLRDLAEEFSGEPGYHERWRP